VHRVGLWFLLLLLGVGLPAAGGFAGPAPKGGTLRISRPRDVDSVDPALAYVLDSWMIGFATCARLYSYPDKPAPEGAVLIPEVATGFPRVSRDGKTQTIELRRAFRFHNGQPVTAANYVAAFNRDANPKMKSPATGYMHEIVGVDAVISGKAQTISGVRAVGPYTLELRTKRPVGDLAARLTMPFFCPIAVDMPIDPDGVDTPLGSGPYYVASRVRNRQVVLERNRFYRGSRPAHVDMAVWTIRGRAACRVGVEKDELDYCGGLGVPTADYRELVARYGINKTGGQLFFNPFIGTDYFVFNHDRPAFRGLGQTPLKQAINWAIDRPALVSASGYLLGKRTDQILPPALGRDASIYPLGGVNEQRLVKARALLRKASIRPTRLVLYVPSFDPDPAIAQVFQFNLKRLGIDVEIKYFPADAYFDKIGTRGEPFDVALLGGTFDYADQNAFFLRLNGNTIQATQNLLNVGSFDRPEYTGEIERINRLSGQSRRTAWVELDLRMMHDDPPWAPYMNGARVDFISKSFGCFFFHPLFLLDVAAACKK
jgi:ABC-type transport system substrate-binding protein